MAAAVESTMSPVEAAVPADVAAGGVVGVCAA
jgi:hypothetical protein